MVSRQRRQYARNRPARPLRVATPRRSTRRRSRPRATALVSADRYRLGEYKHSRQWCYAHAAADPRPIRACARRLDCLGALPLCTGGAGRQHCRLGFDRERQPVTNARLGQVGRVRPRLFPPRGAGRATSDLVRAALTIRSSSPPRSDQSAPSLPILIRHREPRFDRLAGRTSATVDLCGSRVNSVDYLLL